MLKARIMTASKGDGDAPGLLHCVIPSTEFDVGPADYGLGDGIIPVIYTSPYSFHGDGGFIAMPPDGTWILVEQIGKLFYYLTSIVGPDPSDLDEISEDTEGSVIANFSCSKSYDPAYSSEDFPDTVMWRHPKGHIFQMKDDVPMDNEEIKPIRNVHNSKIEMKSAGGKVVSLDDSNSVNALRVGVDKQGRQNNEFDGITIGHNAGITGPRCIKTQAKNNITTTTDSGDIINTVVDGNKFEIENTSTGGDGNMLSPKPKINIGTTFGDLNLVAGNNHALADPIKAILGSSKVIIEALGLNPATNIPVIRISSDGNIEIISNAVSPPGTINIKSVGDINIESTLGNVNIKGLTVNLNDPAHVTVPTIPTSAFWPYQPSLRGYVPFGWMMPYSPPI